MKLWKLLGTTAAFVGLMTLVGCGGSSSTTTSTVGTGTVAVYLTDAPGDYQNVFVSIKEVQVHKATAEQEEGNVSEEGNETNTTSDAGWMVVAEPQGTFDLLELQNGVLEKLGVTELAAGTYTQVRLILTDEPYDTNETTHPFANYVVLADSTVAELKVPSAYNTGIKLTHSFEVVDGETTNLVLDFDANKSVNELGNGEYQMKPTISIFTPEDVNESNVTTSEE